MKLRDIQLGMARALRVPEPLRQHEREHAFAAQIARGNDRLAPVDQLDIYREQFTIRHLDALAEDFEAVRAVLGGRVFDHLASRFLVERPPDMVSLNDLGRDFPAYIAAAELPHQPLVDRPRSQHRAAGVQVVVLQGQAEAHARSLGPIKPGEHRKRLRQPGRRVDQERLDDLALRRRLAA